MLTILTQRTASMHHKEKIKQLHESEHVKHYASVRYLIFLIFCKFL